MNSFTRSWHRPLFATTWIFGKQSSNLTTAKRCIFASLIQWGVYEYVVSAFSNSGGSKILISLSLAVVHDLSVGSFRLLIDFQSFHIFIIHIRGNVIEYTQNAVSSTNEPRNMFR